MIARWRSSRSKPGQASGQKTITFGNRSACGTNVFGLLMHQRQSLAHWGTNFSGTCPLTPLKNCDNSADPYGVPLARLGSRVMAALDFLLKTRALKIGFRC